MPEDKPKEWEEIETLNSSLLDLEAGEKYHINKVHQVKVGGKEYPEFGRELWEESEYEWESVEEKDGVVTAEGSVDLANTDTFESICLKFSTL